MTQPLHAVSVAHWRGGRWRGALIRGASGAGKSDLAIRLMARGWRLVSDDYSHVWACGDALWATAPERIGGLIEARGLGLVTVAPLPLTRIDLVVDCEPGPTERHPEPETVTLAGHTARRLRLDPRPASAVELVAWAMVAL